MTEPRPDSTEKFIDPICGMSVSPDSAAGELEFEGQKYYFCSKGCLETFKRQKGIGAPAMEKAAPAPVQTSDANDSETIVSHGEMKAAPGGEFVDPVCGMSVQPATAAGKYEFEGKTYYFCSAGCLNKFRQNPKTFLEQKKDEKLEAESKGVEYTCPMHPEIVQIGPGSCPICGMALEPKEITLDEGPDPEYVDMTRRFWISAI